MKEVLDACLGLTAEPFRPIYFIVAHNFLNIQDIFMKFQENSHILCFVGSIFYLKNNKKNFNKNNLKLAEKEQNNIMSPNNNRKSEKINDL